MTIVDANVLLHAVNSDSEQHAIARAWLDASLAGTRTVGFPWIAILAFLRISTHPGVFPRPLTVEEAVTTLRAWLGQPAALIVEPTTRHLHVLAGLLMSSGTAGNLVNDAHLAALSIELAAELVSFDADFGRVTGLTARRPDG